VETASEPREPFGDDDLSIPEFVDRELTPATNGSVTGPVGLGVRQAARPRSRRRRLTVAARQELLWITVIYLSARGMLLLGAYLQGAFGHHDFLGQLANWDGLWYRRLANHGYPGHVDFGQTTLGFFPLYPILIWLVEPVFTVLTNHNAIWAATVSGLLISAIGGWIATVFVHRLADGWWGREAARRATILFIVFPGSVVFSMVYSEGILMPLATACLWALQQRRWLLAGVLAGFGSAVQPVGLMLPVMCLASAAWYAHQHRWRVAEIARCAIAPLLSITGAVGFMAFLWIWTGNPLANYLAQHHGWSEKTDPLAMVHTFNRMVPAFDPNHFNQPTINLNLVVGIVGGVILAVELVLLVRARREVSLEAIVWTLGIAFFAYTSEYVPPNPRMLITAFPALMVVARHLRGRSFAVVVWINGIGLASLSLITFVGHALRP
jgi:hypothetical protein